MASGLSWRTSTSTVVSLFLLLAPPADPNIAHALRVVLELEGSLNARLELLGDQDVLVAVNGNTGLLAHLVDPGAVVPSDRRRRVPLGIARRAQARVRRHGDPRPRTLLSRYPAEGFDQLTVLVFLAVLTEVPHVPLVVLRVKANLWLEKLSCVPILVIHDYGPHAVDHLGQVGDGFHDAMLFALLPVPPDGGPLDYELRPWLEG